VILDFGFAILDLRIAGLCSDELEAAPAASPLFRLFSRPNPKPKIENPKSLSPTGRLAPLAHRR
jgi:hypothetical protein